MIKLYNATLNVLLLFLFFFNIKIRGIPLTPIKMFAGVGFFLFLLHLPTIIKKGNITKHFVKFIQTYCLLLFFIFFTLMLNGTYDFSFFKYVSIDILVVSFAAYFIVFKFYKSKILLDDVMKYLVIAYFIQMLIVLFLFFNKNLSSLIFRYIDMGDSVNDRFDKLSAFRAFGIGFGFDFGTATLTCACLCGLYLYLTQREKYIKWLLIVVYCSFVGIFVARTMFIGIAFLICFFFIFPCRYKRRKTKAIFLFLFLLLTVGIILFCFVDFDKSARTIQWAFEFFMKGSLSKKSGSLYVITHKMIFWPGDYTFLFGDGLFYDTDGSQYMNTDVGYMRLILYFGLFGTLCTLFFIYICGKNFFRSPNKELVILALGLVFFQYLFMYKIMYLFTRLFSLLIIYNLYPLMLGYTNLVSMQFGVKDDKHSNGYIQRGKIPS